MKFGKVPIIFFLCLCCLFVFVLGSGLSTILKSRVSEPSYTIPRHIEYSFTLQNKKSRVLEEAEFWAYAPTKQTATQRVTGLEATYPYELITDEFGNQLLHFTLHNLAPYETRVLTIRANLLLSDTPNTVPLKDFDLYLQAEKYCQSGHPEISRFAKRLRGSNAAQTVKNIFLWVSGNLQDAGPLKKARGALSVLKNRRGDCTEFMYVFAALCRANNIPARGIGGYLLNGNAVLNPNTYHNWVEFYEDGAWRIADPQRKWLKRTPAHYVAMRVIGESYGDLMGDHLRFRFVGEGLRVKMNG